MKTQKEINLELIEIMIDLIKRYTWRYECDKERLINLREEILEGEK